MCIMNELEYDVLSIENNTATDGKYSNKSSKAHAQLRI